jgi:anti-sigma factor RsiW
MSENNNIPPFDRKPGHISEEKLLAYLEGRLSPTEQREVELLLSEEGMESDAVDGLQAMQPKDRRDSVLRLDKHLNRSLNKSKRRRRNSKPDVMQLVIAVIVILLLAALAYAVTRFAL